MQLLDDKPTSKLWPPLWLRALDLPVQLVPAVTELVISELLWLNFSSPEKPVYVYLHSIGSQTPDGQAVGFDTEAYAILDTLAYIRPEIHTLALGQVSFSPTGFLAITLAALLWRAQQRMCWGQQTLLPNFTKDHCTNVVLAVPEGPASMLCLSGQYLNHHRSSVL